MESSNYYFKIEEIVAYLLMEQSSRIGKADDAQGEEGFAGATSLSGEKKWDSMHRRGAQRT